jgi:hypothetical protein
MDINFFLIGEGQPILLTFFVQPGELAQIGISNALENANAEKVRRERRDRSILFLCNASTVNLDPNVT